MDVVCILSVVPVRFPTVSIKPNNTGNWLEKNMKVTLIVPVLNELKGLKRIMSEVKPEWYDQLIILDGKSTDGTLVWCARQPNYEVFVQSKSGLWNAYRELFLSGIIKGDIIITFSPDGNSIPEAIPVIADKIKSGYAMVISSRYKDGARSYDDSVITGFGNHLLTGIINLRSRFRYTDALNMFRGYRRGVVELLNFTEPVPWLYQHMGKMSTLVSWEPSLSVRVGRNSLMKVAEVGFDEPEAFSQKRREHWVKHGLVLFCQIVYEAWIR